MEPCSSPKAVQARDGQGQRWGELCMRRAVGLFPPGRQKAVGGFCWLLVRDLEPHSQTCQSPKPANVQGHSHRNALLLHWIAPRPVSLASSEVFRIHLRRPPLPVPGAFPLKYSLSSIHNVTYCYFFPSFTENN